MAKETQLSAEIGSLELRNATNVLKQGHPVQHNKHGAAIQALFMNGEANRDAVEKTLSSEQSPEGSTKVSYTELLHLLDEAFNGHNELSESGRPARKTGGIRNVLATMSEDTNRKMLTKLKSAIGDLYQELKSTLPREGLKTCEQRDRFLRRGDQIVESSRKGHFLGKLTSRTRTEWDRFKEIVNRVPLPSENGQLRSSAEDTAVVATEDSDIMTWENSLEYRKQLLTPSLHALCHHALQEHAVKQLKTLRPGELDVLDAFCRGLQTAMETALRVAEGTTSFREICQAFRTALEGSYGELVRGGQGPLTLLHACMDAVVNEVDGLTEDGMLLFATSERTPDIESIMQAMREREQEQRAPNALSNVIVMAKNTFAHYLCNTLIAIVLQKLSQQPTAQHRLPDGSEVFLVGQNDFQMSWISLIEQAVSEVLNRSVENVPSLPLAEAQSTLRRICIEQYQETVRVIVERFLGLLLRTEHIAPDLLRTALLDASPADLTVLHRAIESPLEQKPPMSSINLHAVVESSNLLKRRSDESGFPLCPSEYQRLKKVLASPSSLTMFRKMTIDQAIAMIAEKGGPLGSLAQQFNRGYHGGKEFRSKEGQMKTAAQNILRELLGIPDRKPEEEDRVVDELLGPLLNAKLWPTERELQHAMRQIAEVCYASKNPVSESRDPLPVPERHRSLLALFKGISPVNRLAYPNPKPAQADGSPNEYFPEMRETLFTEYMECVDAIEDLVHTREKLTNTALCTIVARCQQQAWGGRRIWKEYDLEEFVRREYARQRTAVTDWESESSLVSDSAPHASAPAIRATEVPQAMPPRLDKELSFSPPNADLRKLQEGMRAKMEAAFQNLPQESDVAALSTQLASLHSAMEAQLAIVERTWADLDSVHVDVMTACTDVVNSDERLAMLTTFMENMRSHQIALDEFAKNATAVETVRTSLENDNVTCSRAGQHWRLLDAVGALGEHSLSHALESGIEPASLDRITTSLSDVHDALTEAENFIRNAGHSTFLNEEGRRELAKKAETTLEAMKRRNPVFRLQSLMQALESGKQDMLDACERNENAGTTIDIAVFTRDKEVLSAYLQTLSTHAEILPQASAQMPPFPHGEYEALRTRIIHVLKAMDNRIRQLAALAGLSSPAPRPMTSKKSTVVTNECLKIAPEVVHLAIAILATRTLSGNRSLGMNIGRLRKYLQETDPKLDLPEHTGKPWEDPLFRALQSHAALDPSAERAFEEIKADIPERSLTPGIQVFKIKTYKSCPEPLLLYLGKQDTFLFFATDAAEAFLASESFQLTDELKKKLERARKTLDARFSKRSNDP